MSISEMIGFRLAKQRYKNGYRQMWIHKDCFILNQDQLEEINMALAELYANNPTAFEVEQLGYITNTLSGKLKVDDNWDN